MASHEPASSAPADEAPLAYSRPEDPAAGAPVVHSRPDDQAAVASLLAAGAAQLAILLDFDGVLSPIVDDPAAARPDAAAAEAVRTLAATLPLVACVTGRQALQARELLGVREIAYTGLHGAEVLHPGAAEPVVPQAFAADAAAVAQIIDAARAEPEGLAGLDVEEKGPIVALHWRRAADPAAAEARAAELGRRAVAAGLRSGAGRAVLELRPALERTKGDGVQALLAAAPGARHALYAGDDITDLDAFARLRSLVAGGDLDSATLVAVSGPDAPPQVAAAADVVLSTPAELGALLAAVAAQAAATPADAQAAPAPSAPEEA